jgi:hypothetical protein
MEDEELEEEDEELKRKKILSFWSLAVSSDHLCNNAY